MQLAPAGFGLPVPVDSCIRDNPKPLCTISDLAPSTTTSGQQTFDQPFMVALTQALGVGDNAFDPSTTPLPATTEVDRVRVWK
jgi:hypothetical protein